jgi:hypothetical protein
LIHNRPIGESWAVNKKRIERLWRQEGLQVPPERLKYSGQQATGTRRARGARPSRASRARTQAEDALAYVLANVARAPRLEGHTAVAHRVRLTTPHKHWWS